MSVFLLIDCSGSQVTQKDENLLPENWCKTRYPVLLIHGIALKDNMSLHGYWGKIPSILQSYGCKIYYGGQDAYKSHEQNAVIIAARIDEICEKTGFEKVNIIAHSKGGIESRYLISKLEYADKVSSLTTICTPHHGSSLADLIYSELEDNETLKDLLISAASLQAIYIGDFSSDPYNAGKQLTTYYMNDFNKKTPDSPSVYYQSYSAVIRESFPDTFLKKTSKILFKYEGDNDGLVSVESAKWGEYKGIILENDISGLSHADVIDIFPINAEKKIKIYNFYIQLVHDLKNRSF